MRRYYCRRMTANLYTPLAVMTVRIFYDIVITSVLFLFKDLGSSFLGLELPTFQMNGKRSTNWTLAVIYALRTTKPVHKYHRIYKNLAREKSTQNNLTSHHGRDWHYKCKIVIYMHVLQSLYAPIWLPDTYARHRSSWTTVLDELWSRDFKDQWGTRKSQEQWTLSYMVKGFLKGLWNKNNTDYHIDVMSFVCNLNVLHGSNIAKTA